jgi:hypothetical protein
MTHFDRALLRYATTTRDFAEDVLAHLRTGYVHSTPAGFLMFRPVMRSAPESLILEPGAEFPAPDCWHVWMAAGDWVWMLREYLPYPLPWVSWERDFKLRFWPLEKLLAKAGAVSFADGHGQGRRIKGGNC